MLMIKKKKIGTQVVQDGFFPLEYIIQPFPWLTAHEILTRSINLHGLFHLRFIVLKMNTNQNFYESLEGKREHSPNLVSSSSICFH